ncbi:MAG: TRAP transporter substrate-binding protein [Deinococcota bacterium]|nr:TRAP transporter substrate-binding protein [Deinococcota bacterium]
MKALRCFAQATVIMLALGVFANAAAQEVEMVFASAYAADDHQSQSLVEFARLANEYSDGRINIEVVVGGALGGERDVAEGIQLGTIDGSVLGGILQNFDPAMAILEFPFLFRNEDHVRAVMEGEAGELITDRLVESTGIRSLGYLMRTPRILTTSRPVNTVEDVRGMRIRVPEMEAHLATWRALGANPTPMAFTEVYNALQQGVVDGQENPLGVIYANRFYEVVDYLALTNHLVGFMMIVISEDRYSSLEPDLQEALVRAAQDARVYNDELLADLDSHYWQEIEQHMTITEPDIGPWREAAGDVQQSFLQYEGFEELYNAIQEVGQSY